MNLMSEYRRKSCLIYKCHSNEMHMRREYTLRVFSEVYFQLFTVCIVGVYVACITGQFGVKCDRKCHCENVTEDCQETNGQCKIGCADHFRGDTCQGNVLLTRFRDSIQFNIICHLNHKSNQILIRNNNKNACTLAIKTKKYCYVVVITASTYQQYLQIG